MLKDNVKPREVYCVELRKIDGSLGISVTVSNESNMKIVSYNYSAAGLMVCSG